MPEFGFTTNEIDTSPRVTSHSVVLSGLKSCARYFYRVRSTNASSLTSTSSSNTFHTTGCAVSEIYDGSESEITATQGGTLSYNDTVRTASLTIPTSFATRSASFQINRLTTGAITVPSNKNLIGENIYDLIAVDENDVQISSFDVPVVFTVFYTDQWVRDYVESSLDVYKYIDGSWIGRGCTLDMDENSLTCSLSSFSTYAILGDSIETTTETSTESTVTTTSEVHGDSKQACNDTTPQSSPNLFQIDIRQESARIHFTPILGIYQYYVSYSTDKNAEEHGLLVNLTDSGVQSIDVYHLAPGTRYYFKVRGQNGCMPGPWSNVKSTTALNPSSQMPTSNGVSAYKPLVVEEIRVENPTPADKTCTYIVQPGDSLWKIARDRYGDGSLYKDILERNNATITRSSNLVVGTTLNMLCGSDDIKDEAKGDLKLSDDSKLHDVMIKVSRKGSPVQGVAVEIPELFRYALTNEDGWVLFRDVSPGERLLKLVHDVYAAEQLIVIEGENKEFNVSITIDMAERTPQVPWWIWIIILLLLVIIWYLWKKTRQIDSNR